MLNSTECSLNTSRKKFIKNCTIVSNAAASRTIEEGEIISDIDDTLCSIKKNEANKPCDKNNQVELDDNDDDCLLVEESFEQIVIDDDTTPNIEEEQHEPNFFEDITGSPTLKFTPQQEISTASKRPSCTAVLNSSDVIILDETGCGTPITRKTNNSLDDSIVFVSETAPDYIPLVSENVPKQLHVIRNPFSPKIKKIERHSNDTFFSKSEKKALENYNTNTYNPNSAEVKAAEKQKQKRMVIIDGSNVAFGYSRSRGFDVKGLEICIEYFQKMGHEVKAVVPQFRLQYRHSTDPATLDRLAKAGIVVITPCKNLPGKTSTSYDDRFILQLASQMDAAIVSNDNYRDLIDENPAFKKLILNRVIGYVWVNDMFMIPKDPYGKNGPFLHEILNRNIKKS